MQRPVLAANWKMNNGPTAARAFMQSFLSAYTPRSDRTVVIFPPSISLTAVAEAAPHRDDVMIGAQNVHWAEKGAFTGEISAPMARDAGARMVLVGHSERRHVFGETDAQCAKKCAAVNKAGIAFMLCVGETIEQREAGETEQVVIRQLREGLGQTSNLISATFAIAYEPVWAIGTGRTATADQAQEAHAHIRQRLRQWFGAVAADECHVIYGGSVKPDNTAGLMSQADVDGALVGGASLDIKSFFEIVSRSRVSL
jgi:triosephosphate isomerase